MSRQEFYDIASGCSDPLVSVQGEVSSIYYGLATGNDSQHATFQILR